MTKILLPEPTQLCLDELEIDDQSLILTLSTNSTQAICPYCTTVSERVHSYYWRHPKDLPCFGYSVQLNLQIQRFFCDNIECRHRTFAERLDQVVTPYARQTNRLAEQLQDIAFIAGGEPGTRLLARLGMPVSPDKLLQLIRDSPEPAITTPRVLGVDDWAIRKGQSYGTILVDLEKQQPVDLLSESSADALSTWLKTHPGVEIISRDRGSEYIKGATEGAPEATQVADRWHLLKNLRDSLERYFESDQICLKAAAGDENVPNSQQSDPDLPLHEPVMLDQAVSEAQERSSIQLTKAQQDKLARQTKRQTRYEAVRELAASGLTHQAIAQQLKMDTHTVSRYLQADCCPMYPEGRTRASQLDPYMDYIDQRWQTGCHNATEIWREIGKLGFTGSRGLVAQWAAQERKRLPPKRSGPPPKRIVPWAPSRAAWLFIKEPDTLKFEEKAALERMVQTSDQAAEAYKLAQQFVTIVRERTPDKLASWLDSLLESGIKALARLAKSLKQDFAAVNAALTLPWSQGQVEGQVNRLKLIKRQMYGRAKFDLLRKRVLQASIFI